MIRPGNVAHKPGPSGPDQRITAWAFLAQGVVVAVVLCKDSNNRAKTRSRVARVAGTRRDRAYKHTTAIRRDNQAVYVEDLCAKSLARTRFSLSPT
ncbi:hypothetical protein [Nocardia brevicatena]|uniref:hypothetical protein n=1 Tax=Nocardia brevicatena TaxID=37327 RepID=UPI00030C2E07|nr:hypothetical protein [Nocardia brevicatena]